MFILCPDHACCRVPLKEASITRAACREQKALLFLHCSDMLVTGQPYHVNQWLQAAQCQDDVAIPARSSLLGSSFVAYWHQLPLGL